MVSSEIFLGAPHLAAVLDASALGINDPNAVPMIGHRGEIIGWPDQLAKAFGDKGNTTTTMHSVSIGDITIEAGNNVTPGQVEQIVRKVVRETYDPRQIATAQADQQYNEG
jgi:hypothetical protein